MGITKVSSRSGAVRYRLRLGVKIASGLLAFAALAAYPSRTSQAGEPQVHPLKALVDFAVSRREYIKENVDDYTCWLVKRERIGGELQPLQYAKLSVRCEQQDDKGEIKPMAVFMRFSRPAEINDRRILYVAGRDRNEMLVRKGGSVLRSVTVALDPDGATAKRESNYPISEIGMDNIMERLINLAQQDIDKDPTGENTRVEYFENAKVGDRYCTRIEIEHPQRLDGLAFKKAQLFIDDELRVPVRLVVHDWPDSAEGEPQPKEEYTYLKLQLNVGLTDSDFSESLLTD